MVFVYTHCIFIPVIELDTALIIVVVGTLVLLKPNS